MTQGLMAAQDVPAPQALGLHLSRKAEFRAYQNKRRRLPGRQPTLFG